MKVKIDFCDTSGEVKERIIEIKNWYHLSNAFVMFGIPEAETFRIQKVMEPDKENIEDLTNDNSS